MRTKGTASRWMAGVIAGAVALAGALLVGIGANAQDANVIAPGLAVTDEVTSRDGDEWTIALCVDEAVTITMQSEAFSPLIGVFQADEEDPVAFAEAVEGTATLAGFQAEAAGEYVIVAAGAGFGARGAYTLSVTGSEAEAAEEVDGRLVAGIPFTATLRPLRTVVLGFHGCEGDVIGLEAASTEFGPALEVFRAGDEEPLVSSAAAEAGAGAVITGQTLPATGEYLAAVFGASRLDQGEVAVLLSVEATGTLATSPTAAASPTATPTATPTPLGMACTVTAERLNLRSGPGLEFAPPIGVLPRDTELRAVARDPTGAWIQVQVAETGDAGWTSAVSPFVACSASIAALPLGEIPPRPTLAPTATLRPTPTQQPTPTPQKLALNFVPTDGDDGNNFLRGSAPFNQGRAIALPGFRFDEITDNMVFRDRIVFAVEVFDTRVGLRDGDGIDAVDFSIQDEFGDEVYGKTEESPGYCVFGGGDPNCAVLFFGNQDRWPGGGRIEDGDYQAVIDIYADNGDSTTWRWGFSIRRGGQTISPAPTPVVEVTPPGGGDGTQDTVRITDIRLVDGRYYVAFETSGFVPALPGRHVHFFWDTVPQGHAGVPGDGPWQLYPAGPGVGLSPFSMFTVNDQPGGASAICVLAANADHSVNQGTGNCYPLP